ncbi:MAG TPA: hypothetical protein VFT49_02145 [Candidatus Saccharimonadales bacterium]|nr:hypothetical protein [Candidatus Saccharimonadales bacterium]
MIALALILTILLIVFGTIVMVGFGIVVFFGAPYLPTLQSQRQTALKLLDLKPGQTLYDLGCGDGRMLKTAAQAGLYAVGYELNPVLVAVAKIINWPYRKQVRVVWGNYWSTDISKADGIFIFLLDKYMTKFDKKVKNLNKPIKVASYTFEIPGKEPVKKQNAVFLYSYEPIASSK